MIISKFCVFLVKRRIETLPIERLAGIFIGRGDTAKALHNTLLNFKRRQEMQAFDCSYMLSWRYF